MSVRPFYKDMKDGDNAGPHGIRDPGVHPGPRSLYWSCYGSPGPCVT
jgi:hypothetical protein